MKPEEGFESQGLSGQQEEKTNGGRMVMRVVVGLQHELKLFVSDFGWLEFGQEK